MDNQPLQLPPAQSNNPRDYSPTVERGITHVSPRDLEARPLTLKEMAFCLAYLETKNGTEAAFRTYNCKNRVVAGAIAYENLRKPQIIEYIAAKYVEYGFNEENIFREHLALINQNSDLAAKARGIGMYYELKGSYAPKKTEGKMTVGVFSLADLRKKMRDGNFDVIKMRAQLLDDDHGNGN